MPKYNIVEKIEKEAVYRSRVSPELLDKLKDGVLSQILFKKKYKEKGYTAKQLAEDLQTNTRYISAVLNLKFGLNYTSFVNKLRIDEALHLLVDCRYSKMNVEEIGEMVGFASRQAFYMAFFKFKGITPIEYKAQYFEQHPVEQKKTNKWGKNKQVGRKQR
ncbi:MAG: helix-turn-helix domain-containing protein [Prevotellaceae bacterium]|nr:helix-turn-helix domain-containing protein [Prevotella sp.]MDD7256781.1 helix-turn-helix domain-containing protein [Prevotellaceae bacterium]MDY6131015.1 helix-turn-helix domain-containing protein [Prevotella sp.]